MPHIQELTNADVPTFDPRTLPMLLTVAEVAAVLRLDQSTVYRAVQRGDLAAVRLSERDGGAIRIRAAELERILQDRPAQLAASDERTAAGRGFGLLERGRVRPSVNDAKENAMTDERRASVRSFLQAAVTGVEPRKADYDEAGLGGALEPAARKWAALVRKAARPAPGVGGAQKAAEVVEAGADALTAALPENWQSPTEDPIALADRIPRGY